METSWLNGIILKFYSKVKLLSLQNKMYKNFDEWIIIITSAPVTQS